MLSQTRTNEHKQKEEKRQVTMVKQERGLSFQQV